METENKLDTQLKLNKIGGLELDNEAEDSEEDFIPKYPKPEHFSPAESKEFFQMDGVEGIRITMGSCVLRADFLRDCCVQVYDYLKSKSEKKTNEVSYLG